MIEEVYKYLVGYILGADLHVRKMASRATNIPGRVESDIHDRRICNDLVG